MSDSAKTAKEVAAEKLANYILAFDHDMEDYERHRNEGGDPRKHVYYYAHVVLGNEKELEDDVLAFISSITECTMNT